MRFAFTLVLVLIMAAGVASAQDLQNTLTQPAEGDTFVPDLASTANSQPPVTDVIVSTLTEPLPLCSKPPQNSDIICANIVNSSTRSRELIAAPLLIKPADGWSQVFVVRPTATSEGIVVTPEPGTLLVLAFGLGGLATWRFRTRSHR